jgi:hypothetical protein
MYKIRILIVLLFLFFYTLSEIVAQEPIDTGWDNQIYLSNKIAGGKNKLRYSGELQVRLKDNFQALDNWFAEGTLTYLANEWLEISPDFRMTLKPDRGEFRPGLGVVLKRITNHWQLANQVKWQIDIDTKGNVRNAMREVVFVNYKYNNEKIVSTFLAGFIYRWSSQRNFMQYIRVGPGISYIFDKKHILNFSYFVGVENKLVDGEGTWVWSGIPLLQLVINITKKYRYQPAYYFDF